MFVAGMAVAGCGSNNTATSPSPSTTTSPTSEAWSGVLAPGGASSRSFSAGVAGTISITLTGAGQAPIGLGVGLPRTTGGGCRLGVSVNAAPGTTAQLTTQADAGGYCVQVFDLGTLINPIPFAMTIHHP